jgi:hypothetical protein
MQLEAALLGDELGHKKEVMLTNMFKRTSESTLKKGILLVRICGQGEVSGEVHFGQKIVKVSGRSRVGHLI